MARQKFHQFVYTIYGNIFKTGVIGKGIQSPTIKWLPLQLYLIAKATGSGNSIFLLETLAPGL